MKTLAMVMVLGAPCVRMAQSSFSGFTPGNLVVTRSVDTGDATTVMLFAGSQNQYTGLDQLNLQLPQSLAGSGDVDIQVTFNGVAANPVQITNQ